MPCNPLYRQSRNYKPSLGCNNSTIRLAMNKSGECYAYEVNRECNHREGGTSKITLIALAVLAISI